MKKIGAPIDENKGSDQLFGPERQTFKQRRNHPYGGIRSNKTKMTSIIHTLKQKGSFNELKQKLNEQYSNFSQILTIPISATTEMPGETSIEDEDMNTTIDSFDQSSIHSEYEPLSNIFGSTE
jgi:hypothetical protein